MLNFDSRYVLRLLIHPSPVFSVAPPANRFSANQRLESSVEVNQRLESSVPPNQKVLHVPKTGLRAGPQKKVMEVDIKPSKLTYTIQMFQIGSVCQK